MFRKDRTLEGYLARRERALRRWNRPISGPRARLRAWFNMLVLDHGLLRLVHLNAHRVSPELWRMAQPAPGDLARFARQGVRTIVNLRGGREHGSWQLEKESAERLGLKVEDLVLRSRLAPDRETLLGLPDFFDRLDYPVLAHCKSGADRAGLFAALYLLVRENATAERALAELSLRKGHLRFAQTGILDAFLEAYRDQGEAVGLSFLDWVRDRYDPEALTRNFRPQPFASFVVDRLLRRE